MVLPSWSLDAIKFTVTCQIVNALFFGSVTAQNSNDPLEFLVRLVTFTGGTGFHPLLSFALFCLCTLPLLLVLLAALLPMFNNVVTGAIAGAVLLAGALGVVASFMF